MKKSSIFVILLAICVLSFVLEAKAQANVNELCARTLPETNKYCLKIIAGATSWEQATTWAVNRLMRLVRRNVEPTLNMIYAKLLPNIAPEVKTEIVAKCRSSYSDVVKILLECKDFIRSDPHHSLLTYLGVASMSFKDCREAIIEQKGQPAIVELDRFNDHIMKIWDVAYSVAELAPRKKA